MLKDVNKQNDVLRERIQEKDDELRKVEDAELLKKDGNIEYRQKNFKEAIYYYQEAFKKNPRELNYLNNQAAVFIE